MIGSSPLSLGRHGLCLAAVFLVVACNSVLGIPEATAKDEDIPAGDDDDETTTLCFDDEKSCKGTCVSKNDPNTGCGASSCEPCKVANGNAICKDGACAAGACQDGFETCGGVCTDTTTDRNNCGGCGNTCDGDTLKCVDSLCRCIRDDDCGFNGTCDAERGVCTCGNGGDGDGECSEGSACDDIDSCSF